MAADGDTIRQLCALLSQLPPPSSSSAAAAATTAPAAPSFGTFPFPPLGSPAGGAGVGVGGTARPPLGAAVSAHVREGCLRAMGTLCITQEGARKQLLDSKVRPPFPFPSACLHLTESGR